MTVLALVIGSLIALLAFALWRGRLVAIALAGAECPDCRVPLVRVHAAFAEPSRGSAALATATFPAGGAVSRGRASTWEIHACATCDRVVTTVDDVPSPVADCPSCQQRSLVVYAERIDREVVVDEWCDLCGRRVRTTLGPHAHHIAPGPALTVLSSPSATRERESTGPTGKVLPFRRPQRDPQRDPQREEGGPRS